MSTTAAPLDHLLAERERVLTAFLDAESERLAHACHDLARAFSRGGTLIGLGSGAAATDAAHVAVEFMHPVIVGKRALPALPLSGDTTGFATLERVARGGDIAMVLDHGAPNEELIGEASRRGLLTLAFAVAGPRPSADHGFAVPCEDPWIVQEVQETSYHVLWELVHVFFEHAGLLDDACITCGDVAVEADVVAVRGATAMVEREGAREEVAVELVPDAAPGDVLLCHAGVALERVGHREPEATSFLYPFLESEEHDLAAVLADVRASTVRKGQDVMELRRAIDLDALRAGAETISQRLGRGGRIVAFGNGGSSTDAQDLAGDALSRGHAALALNNDVATITAVANDVGYDNVFSRQIISLAGHDDIAVAISTSGNSRNVVAALEEAHRRGMLTVGIAGYDGGRLAALDWLDHLFVASSDYIPRLQEAHATMYHLLLEAIA